MNTKEVIRSCRFHPYGKSGPSFSLTLYDTNRIDNRGSAILAYRLSSGGKAIFEGADFSASPSLAIDSDSAVSSLMAFLTLRPGDADSEYFENYNEDQLAFCANHAEALANEVSFRFCED